MGLRPEDLFARQYNGTIECDHPQFGKVRWVTTPLEYSLKDMYARIPNAQALLPTSAIAELGMKLFDGNDTLVETLSALTGEKVSTGDISQVEGRALTGGKKALILTYEALVKGQAHYFITYLSRGAEDGDEKNRGLAQEAIDDFENLGELSRAFSTRLSPEAQKRFKVARPLAIGTVSHEGKTYPYFTVEHLPYRELIVDGVIIKEDSRLKDVVPYFTYALERDDSIPVGAEVKSVLGQQREEAIMAGQFVARDFTPPAPLRRNWEANRHDIMLGNALLYYLSGQRFPREFSINAGDWTGILQEDGGIEKIGLITVRGGFTGRQISERDFVFDMRDRVEPLLREAIFFKPFYDMSESELRSILREARSLII